MVVSAQYARAVHRMLLRELGGTYHVDWLEREPWRPVFEDAVVFARPGTRYVSAFLFRFDGDPRAWIAAAAPDVVVTDGAAAEAPSNGHRAQ